MNQFDTDLKTLIDSIRREIALEPKAYEANELNAIIMALPLGESHAALDGVELERLPRLGEGVSVNAHMQDTFFNVIGLPARELFEFTKPLLLRRVYLERLEGWREWRTLAVYLGQEGLEPAIVFRNTPIPIETQPFKQADYYVIDVRVCFQRETPFHWNG